MSSPFAVSDSILDSLVEEVAIVDTEGTIVRVNRPWREFARLGGADESEVSEGASYLEVLRTSAAESTDAAVVLDAMQAVLEGSQQVFEHEYNCLFAGKRRWFSQRLSPIQGEPGGLVVAHFDITERKLAEQERESHRFQLGRAVRAATLGQLSGALAHELNQPLAAILANAQVARELIRRTEVGGEFAEIVADIEHDARRAGQVIQRIRSMIQGHDTRFERVDLNRILDETLTLCRGELIALRMELRKDLAPGTLPMQGDAIALQHMLLNLIVNAYEAMKAQPDAPRLLKLSTANIDGNRITVTISDTGPGIDTAIQEQVFQPLFTTKQDGLGLGLSICQSIVNAHQGEIRIASASGEGTTVTVSFPADPDTGLHSA